MAIWQPQLESLLRGALFASSIRAKSVAPFLKLVELATRATRSRGSSVGARARLLGAGAEFSPEARARIEQTAGEVYGSFSLADQSAFEADIESVAARAGTREDLDAAWWSAFLLVDRLLRHRDLSALLVGTKPCVVVHPTGKSAGDGKPIEVRVPLRAGRPFVVGRKADGGARTELDLHVDAGHVSRRHCELHLLPDGQIRIVDTSSHGTFVGRQKIHQGEGAARFGEPIGLGDKSTTIHVAKEEEDTHGGTIVERVVPRLRRESAPRLGPYAVVRELGRGGMGVVFEAVHEGSGRRCALKLLLGGRSADTDLIARFAREALIGKKLGPHPGIVCAFDMGTAPETGEIYYAMDYVDGASLGSALAFGLRRTLAVSLVVEVARAVAHAHERGVIHRDLKPDNVLLTRTGQSRVLDFGLAKALDDGSGMTATGIAMGTPNFMPPEQVEDAKRVGPLADVYALGGILYVVLTGNLPYAGNGIREVFDNVRNGRLDPPRRTDPSISEGLEALCCRTLSGDPRARPASALAFAADLEKLLAEVVD